MRDFSPLEMKRRNFILDTIKTVYQRYGYRQIETPAMENLSVLEGKYGEEGDKLLFRMLNSGPVLEKIHNQKSAINHSDLTEKGLRYDLTVPFARYVVMHQNEITFPFKRFQVQPVWRADRPQKGRYREFVQCDADVIGSDSLLNEVEMILMMDEVFSKLGLKMNIRINNRKILSGIAQVIGEENNMMNITVAIDKLEKAGMEKVIEELKSKGVSDEAVKKLQPLMEFKGANKETISFLGNFLADSGSGKKGLEEINFVLNTISTFNIQHSTFNFDMLLARGLEYYTGAIFEVKLNDSRSSFTGSLLGGGRYDDLTGIFGMPGVSGVGISFGVDRIYDVMDEMKLFDELNLQSSGAQVMFVNFGDEEVKSCLQMAQQLRKAGINAEIYPDAAKMKKQLSYADSNKIPFVVLVGSEEIKTGLLSLKDMRTGEQGNFSLEKLIEKILTAESQGRGENE